MIFIFAILCCCGGGIVFYFFDSYYSFRKKRSEDHPIMISIVFLSWLLPFLSLSILLPIDILSSKGKMIIKREILMIIWNVMYWIIFSLAWFILPLIRGMMYSGAWTWERMIRKSLLYNIRSYLISLLLTLLIIFSISFVIQPSQIFISLFFTDAMAISNFFGLFLFLIPLGHGLVGIPLSMFQKIDLKLKERYIEAPRLFHSMKEGNQKFRENCYKISILLGNWEREMEFWDSPFSPLEKGLQALKSDLGSFEPSMEGENLIIGNVPFIPLTASSIEEERSKHKIFLKKRDQQKGVWILFSNEIWELEDDNGGGGVAIFRSKKNIFKIFLKYFLTIISAIFLLIIIWAEISIPFKEGWNPLLWSLGGEGGIMKNVILWGSLKTFAFTAISIFIGPYCQRFWIPDSMVLIGNGNTSLSSLLSYGCLWCRLVFPMIMNYDAFLKGFITTSFHEVMGPIKSITILGNLDIVTFGIPIILLGSMALGSLSFIGKNAFIRIIDRVLFSTLYDDGMHLEELIMINSTTEEELENEEEGKILLRQERLRSNLRSPV